MRYKEALVLKMMPVNRLATRPITIDYISSLGQHTWNDPMELAAFIVELLSIFSNSSCPIRELRHVFCSLWC